MVSTGVIKEVLSQKIVGDLRIKQCRWSRFARGYEVENHTEWEGLTRGGQVLRAATLPDLMRQAKRKATRNRLLDVLRVKTVA